MKQKKIKPAFLLKLFFFAFVLVVFKGWFTIQPLSAGDWSFLFEENIKEFSFLPTIRPGVYFPLKFFYQGTAKILSNLSFSWPLIERLVWFWPFLVLTIFSSWYLAKTLFPKEKIIQFFAPFIYLFNTYILMVIGGGQMGVALAYALAPLVLSIFVKTIQTSSVKRQASASLILALQVMFDPRISFLTLGAVALYGLVNRGLRSLKKLALPVLIAFSFHSIWLLSMLKMGQTALPATYGESGWVGFLSFANFSESFSLLHPHWPENIFGKTYLMRPEFLILPILAFGSLLFLNKKKSKNSQFDNSTILYFVLLALIGAFLAKGSNPPFGEIYVWLFKNFPGMMMFRDPSKFYTLIVLSYSVLIPYSLKEIYLRIRR